MNNLKSVTAFKITVNLIIFILATVALLVTFMLVNIGVAQAAQTPSFNKFARPFVIQSGEHGAINNVSAGQNEAFEQDFLRAGDDWRVDGNYLNGGNRLEACEDGQVVNLWIYVHNAVHTSSNHNSVAALDFQGSGIAKNTTVKLSSNNLDQNIYTNTHTLNATINADNAASINDITEIYCDTHEIAVASTNVNIPAIHTYVNEPINRAKHEKAQQVFNSAYILSSPAQIFNQGSKIGYNGNLPACRYYAAYINVQLRIIKKPLPQPEPEIPPEETITETEIKAVPILGSTESPSASLMSIVLLIAISATLTRGLIVVRTKQRN